MSGRNWRAPERDAAYYEVEVQVRNLGMHLRSARGYGEYLFREGNYWLLEGQAWSQIYEADTLHEIRQWLRLPSKEVA